MSDTADDGINWDALESDILNLHDEDEVAKIVDVTTLSLPELIHRQVEIDDELKSLMELHFPRTERGRELHSQRAAIVIALSHKRGAK